MRKTPPSSQPGKLQKRWGLPHIRLGYELARTLGSREAQMIGQQAISNIMNRTGFSGGSNS